jgi:Zn-finger nucleic acid-binding protein
MSAASAPRVRAKAARRIRRAGPRYNPDMTRLSPVTGRPMREIEVLGTHIHYCPATGGIWFDDGELHGIKQRLADAFPHLEKIAIPEVQPSAPAATARACPVDGKALRTYRYLFTSNVFLDECPQCGGIWVDDGELQSMHVALQEQEAYPKDLPPEVVQKFAMAEFAVEHEKRLATLRGITSAMTLLTTRIRPWSRIF